MIIVTHPSKRKGNGYERELVAEAVKRGLDAERARGSDGRSLGESAGVDIRVQGMRLQAKRHGKFPAYLHIPAGADGVVFREDRGKSYVLIRWSDLLDELESGW